MWGSCCSLVNRAAIPGGDGPRLMIVCAASVWVMSFAQQVAALRAFFGAPDNMPLPLAVVLRWTKRVV